MKSSTVRKFIERLRDVPIALVGLYQGFISPFTPPACRFYPTCSTYARQALKKYGIFKGGLLSLARLCRCHPFHPGGYDPLK